MSGVVQVNINWTHTKFSNQHPASLDTYWSGSSKRRGSVKDPGTPGGRDLEAAQHHTVSQLMETTGKDGLGQAALAECYWRSKLHMD